MKHLRNGHQQSSLAWIKKFKIAINCLFIVCLVAVGCSKNNEESLTRPMPGLPITCDTVNMKYIVNIQPIIQANCYSCHGNGENQGGISLDTYAKLQRLAIGGTLVGVITHASGFLPMPRNAPKMSECDISKVKSWVLAGSQNN